MAGPGAEPVDGHLAVLEQIQDTLKSIQQDYRSLSVAVEALESKVSLSTTLPKVNEAANRGKPTYDQRLIPTNKLHQDTSQSNTPIPSSPSLSATDGHQDDAPERKRSLIARASNGPSRIILTTYPGQSGIDPIFMNWGRINPKERGPVVVSRSPSTVRRRNGMPLSHTHNSSPETCSELHRGREVGILSSLCNPRSQTPHVQIPFMTCAIMYNMGNFKHFLTTLTCFVQT